MSLYRKYRPKSFEDMAGQTHIVSTLQQAVKQDKLAHAYLFSGTRGTGKTSTARILAKIILTQGMEDGVLKDQIKDAVDDGSLVDLVEIDAASNRGIDDIRNLLEKIQFTPVVAKAKVYIIDEVHMLTREAFNALLKTLEEPPPYAYFILATTELHKIPATIQSRCQRYLFRQINEEDIVTRLKYVADQEKITVDDAALHAIAHHVQGGLRDALSLLDQLRSLEHVTLEDVRSRIGESGFEHVETVLHAVQVGDRETLLQTVRRMEEVGIPLDHFVRLLLSKVREHVHRNVEQKKSTADLERILNILLDAVRDIRMAPVPGLVLESALLTLCGPSDLPAEPRRPAPASAAPKPPEKPVAAPSFQATPPVPAAAPAPAAAAAPAPAASPAPITAPAVAGTVSLSDVKRVWPDVVQQVEPAFARTSLKSGMLHAVDGSTLIVSFGSAFHKDKLSTAEISRNVEAALEKALGTKLGFKPVMEEEALMRSPAPAASAPPPDEEVDLASAASDIF
jgi:DNA polymerase III subunit gamma/tau